jgi:hypothetical protein|tara:strand:- start:883 stop:2244 length:1362 start_codon:yes stop_codon:yes gene_type:complete
MKNKIIIFCLFLISLIFFYINNKFKEIDRDLAYKNDLLFYKTEQLSRTGHLYEENIRKNQLPINFNKTNEQKFEINNEKFTFKKFRTFDLITGKFSPTGGSSYIDYYDNKIFLASATGIFAFADVNNFINDKLQFSSIKSNIKELIDFEDFYKSTWFGLKDLLIYKNKLYISYTNQFKNDCYNTSILISNLNLEKLIFEKFYTPEICVHTDNEYGEFNASQSGGRIVPYKNNKLLFSIGDYKFRDHAQDKTNVIGKIIEIDIDTQKTKIISMGHRNSQGLYYDNLNDVIISTDHGPQGGDEINIYNFHNGDIENYGWPISSYGEHYGGKSNLNKSKYKKAPLYKSHKKYGFVEPIKYYDPSIAINEITKIPQSFNEKYTNDFFIASLGYREQISEGDCSIHHVRFDKNYNQIIFENIIPIGERIRDMIYIEKLKKIFLFLENTASIGILSKSS